MSADERERLRTTVDPDGRQVDLIRERWSHIVSPGPPMPGHPELAPHLDAVMRAIRQPTHRRRGRSVSEEWYYLENAGPSRFLKVVVAYEEGRGRVITAFARRSFP